MYIILTLKVDLEFVHSKEKTEKSIMREILKGRVAQTVLVELVNPVEGPCKHQHDVDNNYNLTAPKLSSYSIFIVVEDTYML